MLILILIFTLTGVKCDYSENKSQSCIENLVHSRIRENYCSRHCKKRHIQNYKIFISDEITSGALKFFWKSTGLCPPDPHQDSYKVLLSSDMQQNLFHIGSLPNKGITQVRIHWMLDLVQIKILPDNKIVYNFSYLDELIYILWKNNLQPGFELMGNPSNIFTDFENLTQVYMWKNLVQMIAEHYIGLYGIKYVRKWNFETWNEPDHHDFDQLNFTVQGFLNYYDACSEGLKEADVRLHFGGPGGSCHVPTEGYSPFCWALLQHCSQGRNIFTGEKGVRLDYISFHKKGNGSSLVILDEEIETIHYIRDQFSSFSHLPFYNDEADPLKNWSLSKWWRADATYAAMVVKIILGHIQLYFMKSGKGKLENIHFGLLSNDNAFLSYLPNQFTQRTLLARFQVNNTSPKYVEFVKKPVYAVLGLISKMCPGMLDAKVYKNSEVKETVENNFGIIATECKFRRKEVIVVLYNSADSNHLENVASVHIFLNITRYLAPKWVIFEINNKKTNPYLVWRLLGKPVFPTTKQFSFMKKNEEPQIRGPWRIKSSSPWKLDLKVLSPGVTLINICEKGENPKQVENVRFLQVRNTTLYISWQDDYNRCILTYNVEISSFIHGPYIQLNRKKILFPSYWHACFESESDCYIRGFYRVYAVDYWGKRGPSSKPLLFRG